MFWSSKYYPTTTEESWERERECDSGPDALSDVDGNRRG